MEMIAMTSIPRCSSALFLLCALSFLSLPKGTAQQAEPPHAPKYLAHRDAPSPPGILSDLMASAPLAGNSESDGATHTPAVPGRLEISSPQTTVEVHATAQVLPDGIVLPFHVAAQEVLSSAGTWGDFSRFLQLAPGVVWNSDMSDEILVRGGKPSENLFVVDGIEVPNINHLAVEGTTGGFTSMVDTSAIDSVEMRSGVYDSRYSSRLSSMVEIRTRNTESKKPLAQADLGISGIGGLVDRPIGSTASLLLTAHRSVLNLLTNDIGINGVPVYTNGMARLQWSVKSDHLTALSINGVDSIAIVPNPCDAGVTLQVQTGYGGQRSTDGLVWQHVHSPTVASSLTASYSAQQQDIGQQWQSSNYLNSNLCWTSPITTTPVYQEHTQDRIGTLAYSFQYSHHGWLYSAGTSAKLNGINYSVVQPMGAPSPFSSSPSWTDADTFAQNFATGQTGTHAEVSGTFGKHWVAIAGIREETFAINGSNTAEPRASLAYRIGEHQSLHASYERAAQLAPIINIVSYAQNRSLRPLRVRQFALGGDLWKGNGVLVRLEAYRKLYRDEPVSTEYPSLMLANMVDTMGQEFVWLPLRSGGRGTSEGIELSARARRGTRLTLMASATYSRTRYAAQDGVMRPGNFDLPLVASVMTTLNMAWHWQVSLRDTYSSGRPYTPFNFAASIEQSRGVYDLSSINAIRTPPYNRLDMDINRDFHLLHRPLNIHLGVENALNRQNVLGYAWMYRCTAIPGMTTCGESPVAIPGLPIWKLTQMPLFPSAGIRYSF
jgi:hypothetical protein